MVPIFIETQPEGRLLDFCTFINALILHDRILALPAIIPQDLSKSQLYQYLSNRGILYELDFNYSQFKDEEKNEIMDLFGETFTIEKANEVLGRTKELIYKEYINEYFDNAGPSPQDPLHQDQINLFRSKFIDEVINANAADWTRTVPLTSILDKNDDLSKHRLRTAFYWEIATHLGIAFLPDFMRIPILSGYNARVRQSLRMFIESKIAHFKRVCRREIRDDMGGWRTCITLHLLKGYESR